MTTTNYFRLVRARSLHESSRRTPGPITPGLRGYERHLPQCRNETTRRMGPGIRRDDALRRCCASYPPVTVQLARTIQYATAGRVRMRTTNDFPPARARSLHESSRRTPGTITPGLPGY